MWLGTWQSSMYFPEKFFQEERIKIFKIWLLAFSHRYLCISTCGSVQEWAGVCRSKRECAAVTAGRCRSERDRRGSECENWQENGKKSLVFQRRVYIILDTPTFSQGNYDIFRPDFCCTALLLQIILQFSLSSKGYTGALPAYCWYSVQSLCAGEQSTSVLQSLMRNQRRTPNYWWNNNRVPVISWERGPNATSGCISLCFYQSCELGLVNLTQVFQALALTHNSLETAEGFPTDWNLGPFQCL